MLPALVNLAWSVANAAAARRYRAALAGPARAQRTLLDAYLRDNADTAFGRARRFAMLRSSDDYRAAVPIATYDDLAPYVDRIRAGESNVLTRRPVRRLVPSSGSVAARKLIPYNDALQAEFNAAIGPWVTDLFRGDRRLMNGPAYWSVSPVARRDDHARSAVPVGFDDDAAYLGGVLQRLVGAALAVPSSVRLVEDVETFRYVTLLHLLAARDLRLISVWHPSFLTLLLDDLPRLWPALLRDMRDGAGFQPGFAGRLLARSTIRQLERLDPTKPAQLWPHLRVISCWADAHAALHLPDLVRRFPGVRVQPKGLIATEAFVTLPYAGRHPLAITSHFFEFLGDDGRSYLAHELEPGGEYTLVVTTGGGLYRYRLGDRVRVDGFVRRTPSLRFVGRADLVSDRFGEKLSEGFVGGVLRDVFAEMGLTPSFAMLAPRAADGPGQYVLYVQGDADVPTEMSSRLDAALCANPHYRYCRDLGQLRPVQVRRVAGNAYAAYVARCCRDGQRLGDVKATPLSVRDEWDEVFGPT